jgi:hypothetical protein
MPAQSRAGWKAPVWGLGRNRGRKAEENQHFNDMSMNDAKGALLLITLLSIKPLDAPVSHPSPHPIDLFLNCPFSFLQSFFPFYLFHFQIKFTWFDKPSSSVVGFVDAGHTTLVKNGIALTFKDQD